MKTTFLFALIFSLNVFSAPLPNIGGISGRLEEISCQKGTYTTLNQAESLYAQAEASCLNMSLQETEDCIIKTLQSLTSSSDVVFTGKARANETTFQMMIKSKSSGKIYFSSLREGTHADGTENTIMLMFNRKDIQPDEYVIETSSLDESFSKIAYLIVPVKTRILKDQVYFFTDCRLNWLR